MDTIKCLIWLFSSLDYARPFWRCLLGKKIFQCFSYHFRSPIPKLGSNSLHVLTVGDNFISYMTFFLPWLCWAFLEMSIRKEDLLIFFLSFQEFDTKIRKQYIACVDCWRWLHVLYDFYVALIILELFSETSIRKNRNWVKKVKLNKNTLFIGDLYF